MKNEVKVREPVFGPRMRRFDAAAYLGIAEQTLARWACEGIGPAFYRLSARAVVYDREALDAWLAERRGNSNAEIFARRESAQRKSEPPAGPPVQPVEPAPARKRGRPRHEQSLTQASA
jgi:hypothetical protein